MKLAEIRGKGKGRHAWVNPKLKSIHAYQRVKRHENEFLRQRVKGESRSQAILKARKVEHKGMSKHQIHVYEGRLGSLARWG